MSAPRREISCGVVNDVLYVLGDFNYSSNNHTIEAYDPQTDSWSPRANIPTGRGLAAAAVANGKIHLFAGNRCFSNCWLTRSKRKMERKLK